MTPSNHKVNPTDGPKRGHYPAPASVTHSHTTVPPAFRDHADAATLTELHEEAEQCHRCDLYKNATQVVFGEGDPQSPVVLVGEQPGDREDLAGRPFVGPAGRILDECLKVAGVNRSQCYVTNAVKHFKFKPRGKRRLHARPNAGEFHACAWWLGSELARLKPQLIVALGATALLSLKGRKVGLTRERGKILKTIDGTPLLVTVHPSFLLRMRDRGNHDAERQVFIDDFGKDR